MFDITHGQERARAWPKKRGRTKDPVTKAQNEWFLQAQWTTKFWPAALQIEVMNAVKGTPLMPRDLMTMIMAQRLFAVKLDNERIIYSMVARQDVSESLDVLSQVQGALLYRGPQWWQALDPPAAAGRFLSYNVGTGQVEWDTVAIPPAGPSPFISVNPPPIGLATWVNQGTSSRTGNPDGSITLRAANDGTDQIRGVFMPLPATPWSLKIGWFPTFAGVNFQNCGIALRDSVSGKMVIFASYRESAGTVLWLIANYNSPSSKNANVIAAAAPTLFEQPVYLSIADNGVNRSASFGFEPNVQPLVNYIVASNSFLVPDQIGFYTANFNTTQPLAATLFSWQ